MYAFYFLTFATSAKSERCREFFRVRSLRKQTPWTWNLVGFEAEFHHRSTCCKRVTHRVKSTTCVTSISVHLSVVTVFHHFTQSNSPPLYRLHHFPHFSFITINRPLNKFSRFFYKIKTLFKMQGTKTFELKYCPSLETTFSHLPGSIWIPRRKNDTSLEAIQESIHFFSSFVRMKALVS